MSVILETGKFYRCGGDIYLIGRNIPCIANKYAICVTKKGIVKYEPLYCIQPHFKEAKRKIPLIDRRYKHLLIDIFCRDSRGRVAHNTKIVEKYLKPCSLKSELVKQKQ